MKQMPQDYLAIHATEALLSIYPETTRDLIREMVEKGMTPDQVENAARMMAARTFPGQITAVPEHFGMLAEYYSRELQTKE